MTDDRGYCPVLAPVVADRYRSRPYLQAVREGSPGKRPARPGVLLPPAELAEPDWTDVFPAATDPQLRGQVVRARNVARREWRRVVPVLVRSAGLADVDRFLVLDYCVCLARIDQGERALSRDGLLMQGERGWQKSGWTTVVGQYRTQLSRYVRELGLSPASRTTAAVPFRPGPGLDEDDDDPFD